MIDKPIISLIAGIFSSLIIMGLMFYFFLFLNPFQIYESNTLKWIPILIVVISLYLSGLLNRKTSFIWLPLLFIPFIIFELFNFAYFPFILMLIVVGGLTLIATRKNIASTYKVLSWTGIIGIFLFHLITQPLIVAKDGFGYDDTGELINATIFWDFEEKETLTLPSHLLLDQNNNNFDMVNIKGKTHLITFWATWCAPCIEDKPALEKLKKEMETNPDIAFIDISFDKDEKKWVQYLENKKPAGLQLISTSHKETSRAFNFAGIPMHFIVKPDGQ